MCLRPLTPAEGANRVAEATETLRELRRIVEAFEQDALIYPREFVDIGTLSPELRERLKSLGYVH